MIPEWLVFWSLPILLSFSAVPILIKSKTFVKLEPLEKFIFSLALSSIITISFLTLYGVLVPKGFKMFSWVLFILTVLTTLGTSLFYRKDIKSFLRLSLLEVRKAISDPIKLLFLVALFTYFAKVVLFLIYKPIIDPDVIDSYLPFARSVFLADNIPLRDFFSGRPITIPPVGGFILYAWSYGLTGSIFSESFRLIPLPFLLGSVALVYLIGKKAIGRKTALLSSIVFMFLPFQDEALFLTSYYPDLIFLFFCLFFLYLLIKVFWGTRRSSSNNIYLSLIGFSIAISFLLKLQAIFLYLFLALIFVGELKFLPIFLRRITGILFIISFFIAPFIIPWLRFYGMPSFWPSVVLIGLMVLFFLFYLEGKTMVSDRKSLVITCKNLIKVLAISSIGGIWLLRSLAIFHHPIADFSTETSRSLAQIVSAINQEIIRLGGVPFFTESISWPKYSWWGIFYWPILGTFWMVLKLWGLFSGLKREKVLFLLAWGLGWFCFWQIYLGGVSGIRYLLPLTPVLAWAIAIGVEELSRKFRAIFLKKKRIAVDTIIAFMVIFGLLFNLIQSQFLWWNAGAIYYGPTEFRSQTLEVISPETIESLNIFTGSFEAAPISYKDNLIIFAKRLAVVFSARSELASEYIKELMAGGLLVSLIAFIFLLALSKIKLAPKMLLKVIIILGVILILPYFLVFILISEGNLSHFAKFEREKVYSSWGQVKVIEPFLIQNARKEDKVLFYGIPTGLSYFTGLRVYNLEYSVAGKEIIFSIMDEEDKEKIYSFLKERNIRYFVIDTHGRSAERFTQFKKLVKFLAILDDRQYTEQKVFPSEKNAWVLYELK